MHQVSLASLDRPERRALAAAPSDGAGAVHQPLAAEKIADRARRRPRTLGPALHQYRPQLARTPARMRMPYFQDRHGKLTR